VYNADIFHTPIVVQGGVMEPLPWIFAVLQYIIGCGAAGGLWRHRGQHLGFYPNLEIVKNSGN